LHRQNQTGGQANSVRFRISRKQRDAGFLADIIPAREFGMETGAVRPNLYQPPVTVRSTEPEAVQAAATTEVAPEKAVQPTNDSEGTRAAAENGPTGSPSSASSKIKREEYRDVITDSLVFRAIDTQTGEVVRQIPEEALLRLRRAFAETTHKEMTGLGVNRSL
jgi:flagellar protein FlaG